MSQQHTIGKRNTTVRSKMVNGELSVVYHSTEIVHIEKGVVTLNTGGYFTATTKTRMNQTASQFGLGYRVSQKNFSWYLSYADKVIPFVDTVISFPLEA
jgi:hypothetical protein